MRITSFALAAATGAMLSLAVPTAAQDDGKGVQLVSNATGRCLHLRAPDTPGGGGLEVATCQDFPDFLFSIGRSSTQILVKLTSSHFVCVAATDDPTELQKLPRPIETRDCAGVVGSLWHVQPEGDAERLAKEDRAQTPSNACMEANAETGAVELRMCDLGKAQQWTRKTVR
jgi:hypothetical protein